MKCFEEKNMPTGAQQKARILLLKIKFCGTWMFLPISPHLQLLFSFCKCGKVRKFCSWGNHKDKQLFFSLSIFKLSFFLQWDAIIRKGWQNHYFSLLEYHRFFRFKTVRLHSGGIIFKTPRANPRTTSFLPSLFLTLGTENWQTNTPQFTALTSLSL